MSVANEQITQLRAFGLNKKDVTAAYTVRTGRPTDNFVVDNPIDITAGSAYIITVPAGYKMGQTLLLVCTARTAGQTVSVSISAHESSDPEVLYHNLVDEYTYLMWTGTEWVTVSKSSTTTDV